MSRNERYRRKIIWYKDAILGSFEEDPIFLFGNQKSGTSVVAASLAAATRQSATIDLKKEIKHPSFNRIGSNISLFGFIKKNKPDFCKKIIKEPNLTLFMDEFLSLYNCSKAVYLVRNPADNIRSICNRLNISSQQLMQPLGSISDLTPAWKLVVDNRWLGIECENYLDSLAGRWAYMEVLSRKVEDKLIFANYEHFMQHKVGFIKRLAADLGMELADPKALDKVVEVQFQHVGDKVAAEEFFTPQALSVIRRRCETGMSKFGYN